MLIRDIVRKNSSSEFDDAFQDLCDDLSFLDPKYPTALRKLCALKLVGFIQNEGFRLRGTAYTVDSVTGERVWAPWTAAWLEDDWDGDPKPPSIPPSAQPRTDKEDDIKRRLANVVWELQSLVPLLPTEDVGRLVDLCKRLCDSRDTSSSAEGSPKMRTETGLEEHSGQRRRSRFTEAVHCRHKGSSKSPKLAQEKCSGSRVPEVPAATRKEWSGPKTNQETTPVKREELGRQSGSPEMPYEQHNPSSSKSTAPHNEVKNNLTATDNGTHNPACPLPQNTQTNFYANFKTPQNT